MIKSLHAGLFLGLVGWSMSVHAAESSPFLSVLQQMVNQSPVTLGQQSQEQAVQSRNQGTLHGHLPTVSASGTRQMQDDQYSNQMQLTMRAPLYRFGATEAERLGAQAEIAAQSAQSQQVRLSEEERLGRLLIEQIHSRQLSTIQQRLNASHDRALAIAESRYKKGYLAEEELTKIRITVEDGHLRLAQSQTRERQLQEQLLLLPGYQSMPATWPWEDMGQPQRTESWVKNLPAATQHPAIQRDQFELTATEQHKRAARSSMLPSLDGSVGYGWYQQDREWDRGPTAMLQLTVPLFERWERDGRYRAYVAEEAAAQYRLDDTRRNLTTRMNNARSDFAFAQGAIQKRRDLYQSMQRVFDRSLLRFEKGLMSANDLLQDESRLYDQESALVDGWKTLHESILTLCHATGQSVVECLKTL